MALTSRDGRAGRAIAAATDAYAAGRGADVDMAAAVADMTRLYEEGRLQTLEPLLPLVLRIRGKPYTLRDHFPFAPLFRLDMPRTVTIKAGRQVGKSAYLAAHGVLFTASVADRSSIFVTPLKDQVTRFSTNYVKPFIDTSPIRHYLIDESDPQNVHYKKFRNRSTMLFGYALRDADRLRGNFADMNSFDETQDLEDIAVQVVLQTLSYSDWALKRWSGTPKTLDGLLQVRWDESSQAEWWVPCTHCTENGKPTINIPSAEYHLDAMIGPSRPDISEQSPGTICRKCRQPISPRLGRWVHRYEERIKGMNRHAGFHIPQVIMPRHYASAEKWDLIVRNRENQATALFHNETLGESCDSGSKLVTLSDLKTACCLPWRNTWRDHRAEPDEDARRMLEALKRDYEMKILAADWGGGGREEASYTKLALLGWRGSGVVDVLWGKKLLTPQDPEAEAEEAFEWAKRFGANMFAHDFTGAGTHREKWLAQAGYPADRIVPIMLVPFLSRAPMRPVPADELVQRPHYQLAKTRSLLHTCTAIKQGRIRFFQMDFVDKVNPGLVRDFLALVDEKNESLSGSDVYIIRRQRNASDDFAQAVNLGAATFWFLFNAWPDIAEAAGRQKLTKAQQDALFGRLPERITKRDGYRRA